MRPPVPVGREIPPWLAYRGGPRVGLKLHRAFHRLSPAAVVKGERTDVGASIGEMDVPTGMLRTLPACSGSPASVIAAPARTSCGRLPAGEPCRRRSPVRDGCGAAMDDEIISPEVAETLHQRALELSTLAVSVISEDGPGHPGVRVARVIPAGATLYVLTGA
jgi:hypothetical protein